MTEKETFEVDEEQIGRVFSVDSDGGVEPVEEIESTEDDANEKNDGEPRRFERGFNA